jgi:hypothetical protein
MKTKKNIAVENTPAIDNENAIVETKTIEPQVFKTVGFVQLPVNKKQAVVGLKVHKNKGLMKAAQTLAEKKVAKENEAKALEIEKKRLHNLGETAHQKAIETLGRINGYVKEASLKKLFYRKPLMVEAKKALGQIELLCAEFPNHQPLQDTFVFANNTFVEAFGTLDQQIQEAKDKDKNQPLKGAFDGLKIV